MYIMIYEIFASSEIQLKKTAMNYMYMYVAATIPMYSNFVENSKHFIFTVSLQCSVITCTTFKIYAISGLAANSLHVEATKIHPMSHAGHKQLLH